jgi:hypothetical protein
VHAYRCSSQAQVVSLYGQAGTGSAPMGVSLSRCPAQVVAGAEDATLDAVVCPPSPRTASVVFPCAATHVIELWHVACAPPTHGHLGFVPAMPCHAMPVTGLVQRRTHDDRLHTDTTDRQHTVHRHYRQSLCTRATVARTHSGLEVAGSRGGAQLLVDRS